jgi:O-antigen/teichoic acid export membrane protein
MKANLLSRFNRSIKDSSIYAISSILNSGVSFLLLPILTTYYDPTEYGTYSIIVSISVIFGGFFYFGASSSYARYVYDNLSREHKSAVFSQTVNISLLGGLFMILLAITFGNTISNYLFNSFKYYLHFILAALGTASGFFVAILHIVLQFDKNPKKLLFISFLAVLANFAITYLLLVNYNYGILAPLVGILISNLIVTTYLFLNYYSLYDPFSKMYQISNFIRFGYHSSIGGILFYLVDYTDRLLINQILSTNDVGVYSLGYKLGFIINIILVLPFSQAWAPIRMEFLNDKRQYEFTSKIISYYFLAGVVVIFISSLFGKNIFDILFVNKDFSGYIKIFPIIMSSIFMYGIITISNIGLYKEDKLKYQNLIMLVGLIINIILNYTFLEQYGIVAAAFSTLISYSFIALLVTIISNRYLHVSIEKFRVFSLLIVMLLLISINSFSSIFLDLSITQKLIYSILFFIMLFMFYIDTDEKKLLKKNFILQKHYKYMKRFLNFIKSIRVKVFIFFSKTINISIGGKLDFKIILTTVNEYYRAKTFYTKEPETLQWIENLNQYTSKENFILWDIGANIGIYSLFTAKKHPSSIIYSFEPEATSFSSLCKNI